MADLPDHPVTRQEMYLSRLAGENTTLPNEPLTREEMYLEGDIARVEKLQADLEELKNNPDVADIVPTYADLQAYDTSKLTDKAVIRVLADETHDGQSTYYRYSTSTHQFTYLGTAGDYYTKTQTDTLLAAKQDKLVAGENITIAADGKTISATGGGGEFSREITEDDKNYPANNPTSVALWLLDPGVYHVRKNAGFSVRVDASESFSGLDIDVVVFPKVINGNDAELTPLVYKTTGVDEWFFDYVYVTSGYSGLKNKFLMGKGVNNNLTTTTSGYVLDARQGKALNDKITPDSGSGAPTTATVGTFGKVYIDTSTDAAYICTKVDTSIPEYTWKQITA